MRLHRFEESFAAGRTAERLVVANWPKSLELLDGTKGDILVKPTGAVLELKSESRASTDTANLYVERWSDFERQKPGGPWQSIGNASVYAHLYADGKLYVYRTHELLERCKQYLHEHRPTMHRKENLSQYGGGTYLTLGFTMPRTYVADILLNTFTVDTTVKVPVA